MEDSWVRRLPAWTTEASSWTNRSTRRRRWIRSQLHENERGRSYPSAPRRRSHNYVDYWEVWHGWVRRPGRTWPEEWHSYSRNSQNHLCSRFWMATLWQEKPWSTRKLASGFGRSLQRICESGRWRMHPGETCEVQLEKVITTTGWRPRKNGFEYIDNLDIWPFTRPVNQEGQIYTRSNRSGKLFGCLVITKNENTWTAGTKIVILRDWGAPRGLVELSSWSRRRRWYRLMRSSYSSSVLEAKEDIYYSSMTPGWRPRRRHSRYHLYRGRVISWRGARWTHCQQSARQWSKESELYTGWDSWWQNRPVNVYDLTRGKMWLERSPTLRWRTASPSMTPSPSVATRHHI